MYFKSLKSIVWFCGVFFFASIAICEMLAVKMPVQASALHTLLWISIGIIALSYGIPSKK